MSPSAAGKQMGQGGYRFRSRRGSRPVSSTASLGAASTGAGSIYASTILSIEEDDLADEDGFQPLNDQQWILQRKKIGLPRKTKRSLSKVTEGQAKRNSTIQFLRSFRRKECCKFVQDLNGKKVRPLGATTGPKQWGICHCGAPQDEHKSR